jgi:hypothetical protein
MTKPEPLLAALLVVALLTPPAMAGQGRLPSHRLVANTRVQVSVSDPASDLGRSLERNPWGHWGAYYGPMVLAR